MTRPDIAVTRDLGPGETASRARNRRTTIVFGAMAAAGAAIGFSAALVEGHDAPLTVGGTLPGWFAILAALLTIAAVGGGSLIYHRSMDELQRLDNYWAGTLGANVLLGGYPVWLILWKGGLVPPPDALTCYLAVFVTTALAYLWRKLR